MDIAEFAYNNKVHIGTKVLPFKTNQGQDPRMGFEMRKRGKYEGVEKFMERMRNGGSKSSTTKSTKGYEVVCR